MKFIGLGIVISALVGIVELVYDLGEYCNDINPYRSNVGTEENDGEEEIL